MEDFGLTTRRLEALTDGIYAIAMTLLVLNLHIPDRILALGEAGAHQVLIDQAPKFFHYGLSFILLAVFWIGHHKVFHLIERTDRSHTWINVFYLMFVALIPFSTSLIGHYPEDWLDELFFSLNIFAIGSLSLANWLYASRGRRLTGPEITPALAATISWRAAVVPLVATLAAMLALIRPAWTPYSLLLIPIILFHPKMRYRAGARKPSNKKE